ncbi:MAG TPA: hypothetical protein VLB27_05205 [candidate division Zixibacteria bacterium]|nr:hypothetical protein [candidate division Zixibacteria bacterium]
MVSRFLQTTVTTAVLMLSWVGVGAADDIDELFSTRLYTCAEIEVNSCDLIVRLLGEGKDDSARLIMDYWEDQCGMSDRLAKLRLVMEIRDGVYDPETFQGDLIALLLRHRERYLEPERGFFNIAAASAERYSRAVTALEEVIASLADSSQAIPDLGRDERWLLEFLAEPSPGMFGRLKEDDLRYTAVGLAYHHTTTRIVSQAEDFVYLGGGAWSPRGSLRHIGGHPLFELGGGWSKRSLLFQFDITGRFGDAAKPYRVRLRDSLVTTDYHSTLTLGGEFGYRVLTHRRSGVYLTLGLGVDVFFIEEWEEGETAESIDSFNANFGAVYRLFLGRYSSWFLQAQARYNALNFDTDGGTDLSGDALSFHLSIGSAGLHTGRLKNDYLRSLEYYD